MDSYKRFDLGVTSAWKDIIKFLSQQTRPITKDDFKYFKSYYNITCGRLRNGTGDLSCAVIQEYYEKNHFILYDKAVQMVYNEAVAMEKLHSTQLFTHPIPYPLEYPVDCFKYVNKSKDDQLSYLVLTDYILNMQQPGSKPISNDEALSLVHKNTSDEHVDKMNKIAQTACRIYIRRELSPYLH